MICEAAKAESIKAFKSLKWQKLQAKDAIQLRAFSQESLRNDYCIFIKRSVLTLKLLEPGVLGYIAYNYKVSGGLRVKLSQKEGHRISSG